VTILVLVMELAASAAFALVTTIGVLVWHSIMVIALSGFVPLKLHGLIPLTKSAATINMLNARREEFATAKVVSVNASLVMKAKVALDQFARTIALVTASAHTFKTFLTMLFLKISPEGVL